MHLDLEEGEPELTLTYSGLTENLPEEVWGQITMSARPESTEKIVARRCQSSNSIGEIAKGGAPGPNYSPQDPRCRSEGWGSTKKRQEKKNYGGHHRATNLAKIKSRLHHEPQI